MSTGNSQNNGTAAGQNLLALPEGVKLGQYRIIHTLRQGGFSITYLAEIIGSGEQVVIKENLPSFCALRNPNTLQVTATNPNDELQEYAGYLERFVNEARLLAQLNHPNIVKVLGAFEALGTAYYVMPWVGGKELQTAAPVSGVITESWLLPILRTLLSTLEYLHGMNIYNCDVNPSNILLTEDGTPVLIDLGTARTIIRDRSAIHVGCLPWYSPIEQITADAKRGPWTDVYSLGATCYRLITGEIPPDALERLDDDPYIPLAPRAELHGRFSPAFLATIDKALALRGKQRWQTAGEWLSALTVPAPQPAPEQAPPPRPKLPPPPIAVAPEPQPAPEQALPPRPKLPPPPIAVAPEPARRSRPNEALILLILVLALGIPGGYIFYQTSEAEYNSKIIYAAAVGDTDMLASLIAAKANVNAAFEDGNTPLYRAADEGHAGCVKLLLAAPGIDVNLADKDGCTPLYRAAKNGHSECVKLLLAAPGIDVNKANGYGWTPLYLAASGGHSECVKLLLAAPGIDVNAANKDGETPLWYAAYWGHVECVKLLLAAPGIDVNKADNSGETPLKVAERKRHSECARLIRQAGGGAPATIDKATAQKKLQEMGIEQGRYNKELLSAVVNGNTDTLSLLLTAGADVNYADEETGRTPLWLAAENGHSECVKLLLAAPGIDVNKANEDGETPLTEAAYRGHSECVKLLLAAPGIDVNKATNSGSTPLWYAAAIGHSACVKLLLAAPAIDVNKANMYGWFPLKFAAKEGHSECVKLLLAAPGIDVNKADEKGRTPLSWAAQWGRTECVRMLLAAPGIDVNKAINTGRTPLSWAAFNGHSECVKLLLAAPGIDVNKEDEHGRTPLYLATWYGSSECVKLLLAAPGIDVNKADEDGRTPLYRAESEGLTECARLIREAGGKE